MDLNSFLSNMIRINALQKGKFTLASGEQSNYYLDLRLIPSYPELFKEICNDLANLAKNMSFDYIAGIPTAGVPFASYLSILLYKPLIQIRKEIKNHGTKKLIEGIPINGKKILLVDDLVSSGHSKEFAIDLIHKGGGQVDNILVIADRRPLLLTNQFEKEKRIEIVSLFKLDLEQIKL